MEKPECLVHVTNRCKTAETLTFCLSCGRAVSRLVFSSEFGDFLASILDSLHVSFPCCLQPNLYRLMQVRRQYLPNPSKYNHLFSKSQKQNRVELVSDFPKGNDAEVISSLQVSHQSNPGSLAIATCFFSSPDSSIWLVRAVEEQ